MKNVYFLEQLNESDIEWLLSQGQKEEISAGDVLVKQAKPERNIYLILKGKFKFSMGEKEPQQVLQVEEGDLIGITSLLADRPANATVSAINDALVFTLDKWALERKLIKDIEFSKRFYLGTAILLSHQLRFTVQVLDATNQKHERPIPSSEQVAQFEKKLSLFLA